MSGKMHGLIVDSNGNGVQAVVKGIRNDIEHILAVSNPSDGSWSAPGIPAGTYVIAGTPGTSPGNPDTSGGFLVVNDDEDTEANDIVLAAGRLVGDVKDYNTPQGGVPATIQIYSNGSWQEMDRAYALTGLFGEITVKTGTYNFRSILGPYNDVKYNVAISPNQTTTLHFQQGPQF